MKTLTLVLSCALVAASGCKKSDSASGDPASGGAAAPQAPPKITKTGHTDTVAGYQCEDYDITSNDGKRARVCVSEGAASWLDVVSHAVPGNLLWAKDFLNGQKFPLRMIAFETD